MSRSYNDSNLEGLASDVRNTINAWYSDHINNYIRDTLTCSLNLPLNSMPQPYDFSGLGHFIQEVVRHSLACSIDQFGNNCWGPTTLPVNQPPPVPQLPHRGQANESESEVGSIPSFTLDLPSDSDYSEELSFNKQQYEEQQIEDTPPLDNTQFENTEMDCTTFRQPQSCYSREIQFAGPTRKEIDIQPQITDTHDTVIIRVKIPDSIGLDEFRININDTHAAIKWESGYMQHVIKLPPDIIKSQATAAVKNSVLEIRIPKRYDGNSREINIYNS